MQEIKNVYVDVYCIRDGMVHIFFIGDAQKNNSFCVHTKFLRGVEVMSPVIITTLRIPAFFRSRTISVASSRSG